MNYFILSAFSFFLGVFATSLAYTFSKKKLQLPLITTKSISESIKDIKVIVNNNPDKTSMDCYSGSGPCLVLNIPNKSLSVIDGNVQHILINNFKMGTVKSHVPGQKLTINYIDGSRDEFTVGEGHDFGFKEVMKWYHCKESNEYRFHHLDGFITFRRDLIKHIKFKRIKPQQLVASCKEQNG
jgi:hypothetical protein